MVFLRDFKKRHNFSNEQIGRIFGFSGSHIGHLLCSGLKPGEAWYFGEIAKLYDEGKWQTIQRDVTHAEVRQLPKLYPNYKKGQLARHIGLEPTLFSKLLHKDDQVITPQTSYKILLTLRMDGKEFSTEQTVEPVQHPVVYQPSEPVAFDQSSVRTQTIGDKIWFCLIDVCDQIDYTTPSHAHHLISGNEIQKLHFIDSVGRNQEMLFVSEPGLYQFLIRCHLPKAEAFTDWVTSEVLPSIRKTGAYSTKQPDNLSIVTELAKLVGMRTEQIERDFAAKIELLESRIENLPASTLSAEEAAKATLDALAALNAKKAELHDLVMAIVNAAKALPNDDPEAQYYSNYGNAWRTVHRHARPAVSSKNDYTSIDQIQHAINGGQLILARLGGCTQLSIDLGAAA